MCGIVFVGGTTLSATNIERFEQLLYADTFRGEHSTGVMSYFHPPAKEPEILIEKKAVPGDVFIRSGLLEKVKELKYPTQYSPNTMTSANPKFMVGHNRYATAGAVNDRNAHPFQHGPVTLVHNGSLVDQSLLPEHKNFAVDSENICYSIATIGIEETIKKLHGAFTLVWHDARDNTLNFLRNDERPFHMLEMSSGDWYGASEEAMVMWIMTRKKYNPTIKRHFELEVGVQYVFDVSDRSFKFKEERKHELPTFRSTYSYATTWGRHGYLEDDDGDEYGYDYYSNRNRSNANSRSGVNRSATGPNAFTQGQGQTRQTSTSEKHEQLNKMLKAHEIEETVGQRIVFEGYQFDPYAQAKMRGQLTGFVGSGEYIEVQLHGFDADKWKGDGLYSGRITSCYEQNYILTIIVADGKCEMGETTIPVTSLENMVEGGDDDEVEVVVSSRTVGGLTTNYDAAGHQVGRQIFQGVEVYSTERKGNHTTYKDEFGKSIGGVVSSGDSTPLPEEPKPRNLMRLPAPPDDDDDVEEEESDDSTLDVTENGLAYSKKDWESNGSLNCCGNCGSPIPFDDMHEATVVCGFAYCGGCINDGLVEGLGPKSEQSEVKNDDSISSGLGELRFTCNYCGEELPVDAESEKECVCLQCFSSNYTRDERRNVRDINTYRKSLQNGMKVTLVQWEEINSCRWCGTKIPFKKAALTTFQGNSVCCETCESKFAKGEWPHRRV